MTPVHDAYVQKSNGYNNSLLRVENNNRTSYIQFDLSSVTGLIESIELELIVNSDSGNGTITVCEADSDWSESSLNSSNAPIAGAVLTEFTGDLPIGKKLTLDVSTVDLSSSNVTFVLTMASGGNDVSFASKENAALSPVLIINRK